MLAVDAGTHLAPVLSIIKQHLPNAIPKQEVVLGVGELRSPLPQNVVQAVNGHKPGSPRIDSAPQHLVLSTGPFADFELPHATAKANAAHFVRNLITTYLITHPHLDHISGFVINTAGFQHTSRPKRLAGLPSTIDAFKTHIFNDIIWPNLSDEDGGVGLVSYMRLAEGGNLAIGEGESRGYIEVCDGLAVKSWSVSHGKCMHNHSKRGSGSGNTQEAFTESFSRRQSQNIMTPGGMQNYMHPGYCVTESSAFFLRDDHSGDEILIFGDVEPDSLSLSPRTAQVWTDAAPKVANRTLKGILIECSYDESQSDETLFGHLAPRHLIEELSVLADKVRYHQSGGGLTEPNGNESGMTPVSGLVSPLKRKRLSSSFGFQRNDDQPTEMQAMSPSTTQRNRRRASNPPPAYPPSTSRRKSRRSGLSPASQLHSEESAYSDSAFSTNNHTGAGADQMLTPATTTAADESSSSSTNAPATASASASASASAPNTTSSDNHQQILPPLDGLKVIIIHVKDNLKDGPEVGDTILAQLTQLEKQIVGGLGCEFEISKPGTSIWL